MNYLLDTNLVLIYLRNTSLSHQIESKLQLLSGNHTLVISVVTIGELKSLAWQNQWGKAKWAKLSQMLNNFLIADINTEEIIDAYAEIDAYSQGKLAHKPLADSARNMGKNDIWIAATASVLDLTLLTTDHDFEHLANQFLRLHTIDLKQF